MPEPEVQPEIPSGDPTPPPVAPPPPPPKPLEVADLPTVELQRRLLVLALYAGRRALLLSFVLGIIILIYLFLQILGMIHLVVSLTAISTLLAYLLAPAVNYLHARKINRILCIALVYLAVILFVVVSVAFVIPVVSEQYVTFTENLTHYVGDLQNNLRGTLGNWKNQAPPSMKPFLEHLDPDSFSLDAVTAEIQNSLPKIAGGTLAGVLGGVKAAVGMITGMVLVPLFTFYLLMDSERYHHAFMRLFPTRWKPDVEELLHEINFVLGRYIRGQLIVCVTIGVSIALVLKLVGLEYASLIGLFAGVIDIIPYVGVALGMIPAILIAWVNHGILWALFIVVVMETVHWLEGHIIAPAVIGHSVGLPPLVVMIALGAGAELGGIFGMVLAIPVAAIFRVLCLFYVRKMEQLEVRERLAVQKAAEPPKN